MNQKPDYILKFQKPKNTELKHIGKHWYLYEVQSVYDPEIGRTRKISGKILGVVTEQGFLESRARLKEKKKVLPKAQNTVVEAGACIFCWEKSKKIRLKLKKCFPNVWKRLYITTLVRLIYEPSFSRLPIHYENSILSYMYPQESFEKKAIKSLMDLIESSRKEASQFMNENLSNNKQQQELDTFFKIYGSNFDYDTSYTRNIKNEDAIFFLNHLTSSILLEISNEISSIKEAKSILFKDVIENLKKIMVTDISEGFRLAPVKPRIQKLCNKLNFQITDSSVGLVIQQALKE